MTAISSILVCWIKLFHSRGLAGEGVSGPNESQLCVGGPMCSAFLAQMPNLISEFIVRTFQK